MHIYAHVYFLPIPLCIAIVVSTLVTTVMYDELIFTYAGPSASRYAIQYIWCLSQARINWEGCGRKGIRRKIGRMMEVGTLME